MGSSKEQKEHLTGQQRLPRLWVTSLRMFCETLHRQLVTVVAAMTAAAALLGTLFLAAQCLDSARVATGSVLQTYKEFAHILLLRCCRQAVRLTERLLQLLLLLRRLLL